MVIVHHVGVMNWWLSSNKLWSLLFISTGGYTCFGKGEKGELELIAKLERLVGNEKGSF